MYHYELNEHKKKQWDTIPILRSAQCKMIITIVYCRIFSVLYFSQSKQANSLSFQQMASFKATLAVGLRDTGHVSKMLDISLHFRGRLLMKNILQELAHCRIINVDFNVKLFVNVPNDLRVISLGSQITAKDINLPKKKVIEVNLIM